MSKYHGQYFLYCKISNVVFSLLLCLGLAFPTYAEQIADNAESKPSELAQIQCAPSSPKPDRLVKEPVPEHLKYIERPKEFKAFDERIIGYIENNKCIPVKEFKGDTNSGLIIVFDTLEQCEKLRKQVTTLETENITLSCGWGRKPYRCCEYIPWAPYCVRTCATGCAWNRHTANADCAWSCPGNSSCLRWDSDAGRRCAWD